jgi:SAM-dependent methyltransferase
MFTKSAQYYDALYHFKDYAAASAKLRGLIQSHVPNATSLLDVGCGTGKHLEALRQWYEVSGLDINEDLLGIARSRCPDIEFRQGDMTDFDLDRRFDVVSCLFSSIAYVKTVENLNRAMSCMARHLNPGGMLVIEPGFTPQNYRAGKLAANFANLDDLKIAWMYTNDLEEGLSIFDIHYLVGTPQGVTSFRERHELGLFTEAEHESAFRHVGLRVHRDPEGLFSRGMYIGLKDPEVSPL